MKLRKYKYNHIPDFLRKSDYMKYFYNRVRRMKRNGFAYELDEGVMENLFGYAAHLHRIGKEKLEEKAISEIEKMLNAREKVMDTKREEREMRKEGWKPVPVRIVK